MKAQQQAQANTNAIESNSLACLLGLRYAQMRDMIGGT
jgi:hypothetical protein